MRASEFAVERDFLRMTKLSIDALDVLSATPEFDLTFADFFLRYDGLPRPHTDTHTHTHSVLTLCNRSVQEKFAQASEQSHKGREFTNAVREVRIGVYFCAPVRLTCAHSAARTHASTARAARGLWLRRRPHERRDQAHGACARQN